MKITFYGVRGSYDAGGAGQVRYGMKTSCVLVKAGDMRPVIIDMGTGAFGLKNIKEADIFISHYHYDHITGIPFFKPFHEPGSFNIYGKRYMDMTVKNVISDLMRAPFFPITPDDFQAEIEYQDVSEFFTTHNGLKVETISLHHPDGATGYKLMCDGKSIVYLCDNETVDDDIIQFCKNVDLIIYDALYTEEEYLSGKYTGWGHSYHEAGIELAQKSGAKRIALSHHAPARSDDELDKIGLRLKEHFNSSYIASEGMTLEI